MLMFGHKVGNISAFDFPASGAQSWSPPYHQLAVKGRKLALVVAKIHRFEEKPRRKFDYNLLKVQRLVISFVKSHGSSRHS